MRSRSILAAAVAAFALLPAASAQAHEPAPQAVAALDARAAVDAVRKALRENYVLPALRPRLDAALAAGQKAGRYDVTDPGELVRRVNEDLAKVTPDKHLGLGYNPQLAAQIGAGPQNDRIHDGAFFKLQARRNNHGVREMKLLDGNIRYLRYDGFMWTGEESQAAIDAALAFLRGGDAIIIDIRGNGGGSPDAVRRLASYFVPPKAKLVTFHMRNEPPTDSIADAEVPGGRISGVPVYVLTSENSASAAEEFASHVAGFKFGRLVGDTTAGAGYRNENFAIPGGFVLSVSVGRPELPDGSDWEAKGVAPQLKVPADQALNRAQQAAYETLAAKAQGPERARLEWAAAALGARANPAPLARALDAYAGRYGPRSIAVENGKLIYRRDGGITTELLPMGPDLFVMDADSGSRVRFKADGGAVTGFELLNADGRVTPQPRGEAS